MDGRKNNGGHKNGGRKPKAEELKLIEKLSPFENIALEKLVAGVKKGDYAYIKLYMEYLYGKPKQILDVTTNGNDLTIPVTNWVNGSKSK